MSKQKKMYAIFLLTNQQTAEGRRLTWMNCRWTFVDILYEHHPTHAQISKQCL